MPETLGSRTCLHCLRPLPGPNAAGGRRCRYCGTFLRRPFGGAPAGEARSSASTVAALPPAAASAPRRSARRKPIIPTPDWAALQVLACGPALRRAELPEPANLWPTYAAFLSMSVGVLSWIFVIWKLV